MTQKEIAVQMAKEIVKATNDNAYIIKSSSNNGYEYSCEVLTREEWKSFGSDLYGCTQDPTIDVTVIEPSELREMILTAEPKHSLGKFQLTSQQVDKLNTIESYIKRCYISGHMGERSGKIFLTSDLSYDYFQILGAQGNQYKKTHSPAVCLVHGGIVLIKK